MPRPALAVALVALAAVACEPVLVTGDGGADASSSDAQTASDGAAIVCGVFGKQKNACEACAVVKCCDQGKACAADSICATCVAADPSTRPGGCQDNAAFKAAASCINGPCVSDCGSL